MIISRAPVRISICGGGTDLPSWLNSGEGKKGVIVGGAINKYSYITARDFPPHFDHQYYIAYSEIERVNHRSEIKHRVIRKVLEYYNITNGMEICHLADIFSKGGLGSSSAFIVALLHALGTYQDKNYTASELADACIHVEQRLLVDNVGAQDGLLSAYGGFNVIRFEKGLKYQVIPMGLSKADLELLSSHLMLYYTGISRIASDVTSSYINLLPNKQSEQEQMLDLAEQAIEVIQSRNFTNLGRIMHKSWLIKRSLSDKVSNPEIDKLYQQALSYGALGGKLCGAGSGGCLLLCVEPGKKKEIRQKFSKLVEIPFKFSPTGAEIVLNKEM